MSWTCWRVSPLLGSFLPGSMMLWNSLRRNMGLATAVTDSQRPNWSMRPCRERRRVVSSDLRDQPALRPAGCGPATAVAQVAPKAVDEALHTAAHDHRAKFKARWIALSSGVNDPFPQEGCIWCHLLN